MSDSSPDFSGARAAVIAATFEMERLLHGLTDSHGRVADEIHQVRKAGKRLRGGLSIIGEPKPCIRWVAVIGRMLSASRDATVRIKTWQSLGFESPAPGSIEAAIASLLELDADAAARRPPQPAIDWAMGALGQVRGRLEVRTDESIAERAAVGAEKLRRKLRKHLKRALQRVSNKDFHDCRKAAKAWLGGMSMVATGVEFPGGKEAHDLTASLGDENDLEVLAEWLTARGFTPATASTPWKTLRKRQEKVRRHSISLIRKELLPALKAKDEA